MPEAPGTWSHSSRLPSIGDAGRPAIVPRYGADRRPASPPDCSLAAMPTLCATAAVPVAAPARYYRHHQSLGHALAGLHLKAHSHYVADMIAALAKDESVIARFIDFRTAGPGTLPEFFAKAEIMVCTEDSTTMISEAVSARLPVLGVRPAAHGFNDEEQATRDFLLSNNWCRVLPIAELSPEALSRALAEIKPLEENPLDILAAKLKDRLPQLLSDGD